MGKLKGIIRDSTSGSQVAAKVHVLNCGGNFLHPADSILKVGSGDPFFYSDGEFEVNVTRGYVDIIVERGTEYEPLRQSFYMPATEGVESYLVEEDEDGLFVLHSREGV